MIRKKKTTSVLRPALSPFRVILSLGLLLCAFALNASWFQANYPSLSFMWDRLTNLKINLFRLGLVGLAIVVIYPAWIRILVHWLRTHRLARWLASPWQGFDYASCFIPLGLASILRQSGWWGNSSFSWYHPSSILAMVDAAIIGSLLWLIIVQLIVRWRWLVFSFALATGVLSFIDRSFVYYSGTRFSVAQFSLGAGGWGAYLSLSNCAVLLLLVLLYWIAAWRVLRVNQLWNWSRWRAEVVMLLLLLMLTPGYLVHLIINTPWPALWRNGARSHYIEAERFAASPFIHLARTAMRTEGVSVSTKFLPEEVELLANYRRTTVNEQPPKLAGNAPTRIVLVTIESFSSRFQSARNSNLPGALTPFLDAQQNYLSNFRSVSLPTQFGLASHFCSHPNGIVMATSGHPNALPNYLASRGWLTVNFQPASLSFQSAGRRFREMGFQHIMDRDYFARDPGLTDYISGWGLCDRKVYERAAIYLAEKHDKPVFMHILTADTHGPEGRLNYHGLSYPETPDWIQNQGRYAKTLESWFRADFDLSVFIAELEKFGVWDERTVIIVTGDHNAALGYGAEPWAHNQLEPIEKMPWVLVTPRRDLKLQQTDLLASQCDTAPTIAHLAGLPLPRFWWGQSVLAPRVGRPLLAWRERLMEVGLDGSISDVDSRLERVFWKLEGDTVPSQR